MFSAKSASGGQQTPAQEVKERIAEGWQVSRLLGLDHLNKTLAAARGRTNDSHKLQMAKLQEVSGHEVELEKIGDEMSDIRVAGDTTNYINQSNGIVEKLLASLLSLAIGAGCAWFFLKDDQPDPTVNPGTYWQLGLEVKDTP